MRGGPVRAAAGLCPAFPTCSESASPENAKLNKKPEPPHAVYTESVTRRFRSGLTIFGYFTAVGLLFFGYRYLEFVANR